MDADRAEKLRAIAFECEYWKALCQDGRDLNDGLGETAQALADSIVALLTLMTCPEDQRNAFAADAMDAIGRGMRTLHTMQAPLKGMLDLAGGRVDVLSAALDGVMGEQS